VEALGVSSKQLLTPVLQPVAGLLSVAVPTVLKVRGIWAKAEIGKIPSKQQVVKKCLISEFISKITD
jgi:hypothetical protein